MRLSQPERNILQVFLLVLPILLGLGFGLAERRWVNQHTRTFFGCVAPPVILILAGAIAFITLHWMAPFHMGVLIQIIATVVILVLTCITAVMASGEVRIEMENESDEDEGSNMEAS